jgi:uncharacterized protein YciI
VILDKAEKRRHWWIITVEREEAMNYYLLEYHVVDDYVARRAEFREEHLRLVREAHSRSELILAGALTDPADRALLVFRSPDQKVVEEFVSNDPYIKNGLVARWEIRPWNVVIGRSNDD